MAGVELVYLSDFVQKTPWKAAVGWVAVGAAVLAVPLAWRRRFPVAVMVAVSAVFFVLGAWVGIELYASQVVVFLAFYSVGAWSTDRRLANWSRGIVAAGMGLWLLWAMVDGFTDPEVGERGVNAYMAFAAIQLLVNIAYFAGAWVFGNRTWRAAMERQDLEHANAEIRAQQDQLAEQAVSLERLRIARELHDVVAHHVTAMGVQAGAARVIMPRDPEAAGAHLRGVEVSAREAVAELKTMVHTLRDGEELPDSVPRLADLEHLVEEARAIGQDVVLERVGPQPQLAPPAQLALYRVAQEGLTNARKHAGPRAAVTVRLRHEPGRVELEVSDDGRGGRRGSPVPTGTGLGVIGMRERMASVGGSCEAGPKDHGGWLVRAAVPTVNSEEI
ncbi:sensor histidine kinase [Micrococcus sp.]|uniref:sensor histidine kinase n=1 Tax=Micrococcus sp. TaxID=1271 RepID=UPI002A911B4C|nr:sensor histidine kinase [Micrococcus sp.]MDY6056168.1 sensor histidine kinase [Micrococcus sp.]